LGLFMGSVRSGRVKLFSESEELCYLATYSEFHIFAAAAQQNIAPPLIALIVRAFLESVSHMISLQHKCIHTNKLTTVAKVEMPCSKAEIGYLLITLLRRKVGLLLFWGIPPNPLQYDVACTL